MVRAYIISISNGTVQIGDTLFQPVTGKAFKTSMSGLRGKPYVDVKSKSMVNAKLAMKKYFIKSGKVI